MQIFSLGDNLHEMSNPFYFKKNISKCRLLKILLRVLSFKNMVNILSQTDPDDQPVRTGNH